MTAFISRTPQLVDDRYVTSSRPADVAGHTSSDLALAAVAAAAASVAATTVASQRTPHPNPDASRHQHQTPRPLIRRSSSAASFFENALTHSSEQQRSSHRRRMSAERPRVRAEGPGGPDVKQGARIACLDCRSAKIRCSAPTDGKVPCKRCARHGRDCVFEKHRRGRKPGRSNNSGKLDYEYSNSPEQSAHPHYDRMSSLYASSSTGSPATASSQDPRDQAIYQTHASYSATSSPSHDHGSHVWRASTFNSSDPRISTPPVHGLGSSYGHAKSSDDYEHDRRHHSSLHRHDARGHSSYLANQQSPQLSYAASSRDGPQLSSPRRREEMGVGLASGAYNGRHSRNEDGSASKRDGSGQYSSIYTSPRYTPSSEQVPPYAPTSSASNMPPPLVTTPGSRSWLDFPTPGSRSLMSPSHGMPSSSAGGMHTGWPGSAVASPHKRKSPGDYFAGAVPVSSSYSARARSDEDNQGRSPHDKRLRRDGRDEGSEEHADFDAASTRHEDAAAYEDEEHIDQLDEDMVNAGHEDDALSTPLRLLAHASDAAAALKHKQDGHIAVRSGPRSAALGATTMGLVSPPIPRLPAVRSWLDHKPRLPMLGPYQRAGPGSLLPTLIHSAQRRDQQRLMSLRSTVTDSTFAQPRRLEHAPVGPSAFTTASPRVLGALGRSKSFTAMQTNKTSNDTAPPVESLIEMSQPPMSTPSTVTADERRAEILGINVDANGKSIEEIPLAIEKSQSITPSTLDHDAWEYRDGRVRARKSISNGALTSVSGGDESHAKRTSDGDSIGPSQKGSEGTTAQMPNPESVASEEEYAKPAELPFSKPRPSFSAGTVPRRWHAVQRRFSKLAVQAEDEDASSPGSDTESDSSEKLGAAHRDFFSMSIFHSKMDNEEDLDPVTTGILTLRELEKLFDIFFARINPVLTLFDPFLHSVTYVRARSALLTSVMAALAARLSDTTRDAEIAVKLERHWRHHLLPEALLGGYKSVELSQAFAVLSLYHKPTNRLSEDRSWQYLGFAIRIATEIGINRLTQPSLEVKDNEQVGRRMRNRARLWMHLFLADRALSLQTGRQTTLTEDSMLANSDLWHREAFALPSDARVVSLLKLKRIITLACQTHDAIVATARPSLDSQAASSTAVFQWHETIKDLNFACTQATSELDRWQDVWCSDTLDESTDGIQTLAISSFLQLWRPRALIDNLYARLHLNSLNLETIERLYRLMLATGVAAGSAPSADKCPAMDGQPVQATLDAPTTAPMSSSVPYDTALSEAQKILDRISLDCWEVSLRMLDIFNTEIDEELLSSAPNALAIKIIYASLAAVRLSNGGDESRRPWASRGVVLPRCRKVAERLIKAGCTPEHRNGAASPFGTYLMGIVSLWESDSDQGANKADATNTANARTSKAVKSAAGSSTLDAAIRGSYGESDGKVIESSTIAATPSITVGASTGDEPMAATLASSANSSLQRGLVTPGGAKSTAPSNLSAQQQHTVGDDIWGSSNNRRARGPSSNVNTPAGAIANGAVSAASTSDVDRMWDYLTTYTETSNTFPLSLWQQQMTLPSGSNGMAVPSASFALPNGDSISASDLDTSTVLDTPLVPELAAAANSLGIAASVSTSTDAAAPGQDVSFHSEAGPTSGGAHKLANMRSTETIQQS